MAKPSAPEVVVPAPRGGRTEVSEIINAWGGTAGVGEIFKELCRQFRIKVVGARAGGLCSPVPGDTTEVQRGEHGGEAETECSDYDL
jgi:hypothetical protein